MPNKVKWLSSGVEIHIWNRNVSTEHAHKNRYEFAVCTNGQIKQVKNNTEESIINSGDVIFITPADIHSLTAVGSSASKTTHINVSFTPSVFKDVCSVLDISDRDCDRIKRQITLKKEEAAYIKSLIDACFLAFKHEDTANQTRCIKTLIFVLTSIFLGHGLEESHKVPQWLSDFVERINNPEYFNMKICDLYRISGYSQTSLSNYFRKYFNKSFIRYFNELKLNYACALLKNTDYLMIKVASDSGFSSLSNFNMQFKKTFGFSPSEYRENFSHI